MKTDEYNYGVINLYTEMLISSCIPCQIENVTEFLYLRGLLTWDSDCYKEIKRRLIDWLLYVTSAQKGY